MNLVADNKPRAVAIISMAMVLATSQDAVVKVLSGVFPSYEAVMFRGLFSLPILLSILFWRTGFKSLFTIPRKLFPFVILRALVLCSSYFCFIISIASMPLANAVGFYFTMPFFVALLSGLVIKEKVPWFRWVAMVFGFLGVMVMLLAKETSATPTKLSAIFFALYSAFGYAVGQLISRSIAKKVEPIILSNWQNIVYSCVALALFALSFYRPLGELGFTDALAKPFRMPEGNEWLLLFLMGCFSASASLSFVYAYRYAPANFVASFEYSAMFYALCFDFFIFGQVPNMQMLLGIAIVIGAGIWMLRKEKSVT